MLSAIYQPDDFWVLVLSVLSVLGFLALIHIAPNLNFRNGSKKRDDTSE